MGSLNGYFWDREDSDEIYDIAILENEVVNKIRIFSKKSAQEVADIICGFDLKIEKDYSKIKGINDLSERLEFPWYQPDIYKTLKTLYDISNDKFEEIEKDILITMITSGITRNFYVKVALWLMLEWEISTDVLQRKLSEMETKQLYELLDIFSNPRSWF